MALKDSADEMTFNLLEVPIVDKDIEGAVDNVTLDGNQYTDYLWLKKQFIQKWSLLCDDEYTRLRGFYTRQFENADVPSYRLYYGDDIVRNFTESGERIELSISGVADGTMSLTQMDGNTTQQTYSGKNLLNVEKTTQTVSGVTFTINEDKTIIANGTASALITFNLITTTFTLASGQYYLSGCPSGGSDSTYRLDINNGADGNQRDYGNGSSFTLSESTTISNVRIRIASGATVNRLEFKPMINTGSTAQPYEPYVGGIPAPNPSYPQPIETVTGRQTVGIVSKNLYDPNSTVFANPSLVSVEVEGDVVKATALANTTSGDLFWRTPIPDAMLEHGKTYTASSVLGSGAYRTLKLQLRNHDGTNAGFSNGYTITYDSNYTLFVVENPFATSGATQVTAGTTCTISNIQVEEGSTATTYEPYEGQNYEINLGKNLFDKDNANILNGGITTKIENAPLNRTLWIPCEPNTTYTVQKRNDGDTNRFTVATTSTTPAFDVAVADKIEDRDARSITCTTGASARYLCVQFFRTVETVLTEQQVLDSIQIEKGSTASSYSAYFTPIELCKIGTYQDRIYKDNGKWWLHKEVGKAVLNGSETWTGWQQSGGFYRANTILDGSYVFTDDARHATRVQSSHFTSSTTNNYGIVFQYRAETLFYPQSGITSLANFKTWLGTALPSVYYVLATPTTTEITNEEVLEGLEALQDEAISVGQHNIYTDTPNALPTLTFDLTEYLSRSTTIIPETAVRLTLTDGGVINACGCRKDVQLTMRETIE